MLQAFSSWILGSFRMCHSVCLPHAEKCHYSQQFPPNIIWHQTDENITSVPAHAMQDTTCTSVHFPPHSLHVCCSVLQSQSESCGFSRCLSNQKLTLACPDFCLMTSQAWLMLNWDHWECITIGMTSSRYDIFHYSRTPPRISLVSWLQGLAILTCNFESWYLYLEKHL